MNLSVDQRWLLLHMGGWEIVGALCSPEAVKKLMQSCWGSSGGRSHASDLPNSPAWLKKCGWETSGGVITLKNARNCIYWPSGNGGFGGLASEGPANGARIGARVSQIELRKITAVAEVTADAVAKWEAANVYRG